MELFHTPQTLAPPELLALEESLLEHCESTAHQGFLSFWEATTYFVVLGYGKRLADEVFEGECQARNIPILRRCSGGGTVLQGPGCLNYTLVLPIDFAPELETITGANRFIVQKNRAAISPIIYGEVSVQGHTDLTLNGLKFSGNAQRRKRRCLLFHGSILLNFDLTLISKTLRLPQQQPEYRENRNHEKFLTNCHLDSSALQSALTHAWNTTTITQPIFEIVSAAKNLAALRYTRDEWNRRS